jgi:hypothetical protein
MWKCTSDKPLDNLSFIDSFSLHGKQDYWYLHSYNIHRDRTNAVEVDPLMEIFGISCGSGRLCKFEDSDGSIGLTFGWLQSVHRILSESDGFLSLILTIYVQFSIRFTYTKQQMFSSYSELKANATSNYSSELKQ